MLTLNNKLNITITYGSKCDVSPILDRVKHLIKSDSICHQDTLQHGKYAFQIEDLSEVNLTENSSFLEEPDFIEVKPRVEIINGKTCHVYVSKMNFSVE